MHLILWDQQGPISATPHTLCEEIIWGVLTSLLFFTTDPFNKSSNWLNGDYLSEMPLAVKASILHQINILFFLKVNSWSEPNDGMVILHSWLFLTPSQTLLRHCFLYMKLKSYTREILSLHIFIISQSSDESVQKRAKTLSIIFFLRKRKCHWKKTFLSFFNLQATFLGTAFFQSHEPLFSSKELNIWPHLTTKKHSESSPRH